MTGAKTKQVLETLLKTETVRNLYGKYSKRYHIDKLLDELLARGFITGKLSYNRRIYVSTTYTIQQLPEAIKELLLKNNSKTKRDQNTALEREARSKLNQLLKMA